MGAVFSLRDLVFSARRVTETLARGRLGILSEQDGEPCKYHVTDMSPHWTRNWTFCLVVFTQDCVVVLININLHPIAH